jgi:hypothetical protein
MFPAKDEFHTELLRDQLEHFAAPKGKEYDQHAGVNLSNIAGVGCEMW